MDTNVTEIKMQEDEDGTTALLERKLPTPTPSQASSYEREPWLCTGLVWNNLPIAERMELTRELGLPAASAIANDIASALPKESQDHLAYWQQQINDGLCWHTSGSIGAYADSLMRAGFLLMSHQPIVDYWGKQVPERTEVQPGMPGSAVYVRALMSEAYLQWIDQVR